MHSLRGPPVRQGATCHVLGATHVRRYAGRNCGSVYVQLDIGSEKTQQRLEITAARRIEIRARDFPLPAAVARRRPAVFATDASSRATRELSCRLWRTAKNGSDIVERKIEHVVQHERYTLSRLESLQDDEQRDSDRVREHGFTLRIEAIVVHHDWSAVDSVIDRGLAARLSRPEC